MLSGNFLYTVILSEKKVEENLEIQYSEMAQILISAVNNFH